MGGMTYNVGVVGRLGMCADMYRAVRNLDMVYVF
jgi:hypothetical protein